MGAVAPPMMAPPTWDTQAIPFGGTQTLAQIPGLDTEEPEPSRTGLYAVILAVLLAALAVVVLFLGQSLGWWHLGSGNSDVTITDLSGQTVTAAEQTLHQQGLKYTVNPDATSAVSNKKVIRTSPAAGAKVQKGSTVELITGGSGRLITVTSFVNTRSPRRRRPCGLSDCNRRSSPPSSAPSRINIVCSQTPQARACRPRARRSLSSPPHPGHHHHDGHHAGAGVAGDTQSQACNVINGAGFHVDRRRPRRPTFHSTRWSAPVRRPAPSRPRGRPSTSSSPVDRRPSSSRAWSVTARHGGDDPRGSGPRPVVVNCQPTGDSPQDDIVQSQSPSRGSR